MSKSKKSVQRDEGIGPFKIVATVFGEYQYGAKVGKTNPKAFTRMTVYGDTFKKAIAKLNMTEAFYRLEEVVDEGKELMAIGLANASYHAAAPVVPVEPEEAPFVPGLDELVSNFLSLEGLRN
jgi:hypothetical protein